MDRDQDLFFDEEPVADKKAAPQQTDAPVEEEQPVDDMRQDGDDDHTYLMTLLNYLENALTGASVMPLTGKRLVDTEMCLDIIHDIRGNLPLAIQYAEQVMRDRENILVSAERTAANKLEAANARADSAIDDAGERSKRMLADAQSRADKIVMDAEVRARAMVDQNAIKIAAQNEARSIVNEARAEANERKLEASAYGEDMMINVEKELQRAADMVRQRRQAMGSTQQ